MSDQTDTFLREVQEDMQREKMAQIWDRYGVLILGLVALLVAAVGGYKYMEYRQTTAANAAGVRFEQAAKLASEGKAEEANKEFQAIIADAPPGYGALARLRIAATKTGDEAVAAYDAVAKQGSVDVMLRDYAAIQAALLRVDRADWTEMQNRLNDLTNEKNPWRAASRELLGLAALKAGKLDEARKAFDQLLGDQATPPSMLERIRVMMSMLTEQALAKDAATETPATKDADKAVAPKGK